MNSNKDDNFVFWEQNYDGTNDRPSDKIDRIEIINHAGNQYQKGRLVVAYKGKDFKELDFSLQDDGRTLKIFLS